MSQSGKLTVRVLGSPQLEWAGSVLQVASRKSLALLCLLAVREGRLQRPELAELLWPGGGLGNLRQALYQLRRLPGADEWLLAGDEVELVASTDLNELEEFVNEGRFKEAAGLWRGEFLEGLDLDDMPDLRAYFDEEAMRALRHYRLALVNLAAEQEQAGDLSGALATTESALRLDSLNETVLRQAMRLEFLNDQSAAALLRYDAWSRLLESELGSEPQEETQQLAAEIRLGRLPAGATLQAVPARQRPLLGAIKVGGGRLDIEELAQVLRREAFEVSQDVESLKRGGVIKGPDDAAATDQLELTVSDAELLEGRIAELLEAGQIEGWENEARVAGHWLRSGAAEKAAPWFLRSAKGALAASRLDEASEYSFRASWAGNSRQRFDAMMLLETVSDRRGDDSLQSAALEQADDLAWQLQDDAALCRVQLARARSMVRRKQNGLAMQHAEEAMEIALRTGDSELQALAYNGIGVIRFGLGDLNGALEAFSASAELDVPGESMRALSNMGAIHGMREEHEEAYRLFDRTLTLARRASDLVTVSACLNNLSASADRLGAYDRALKHLHEGRQLAKRLGHRSLEAQQIHNLSVIYMRQGAFGPAWNTSFEVVEEGERTKDVALKAQGLEQASEVARQCGAHDQHIELLDQALEFLNELADQRRLLVHAAVRELAAGPHLSVPKEVAAVESLGLRSLYQWMLLELALLSHDRDSGLAFLQDGNWQGPHQEFVAELARARLLLLDPTEDDLPQLSSLAASLALTMATSEFAEAPQACHVLWQVSELTGHSDRSWLEQRDELLSEQARGLPARLRESLRALPDGWPASVQSSQR